MREFEIEQASLNVTWKYERLLPALPVTGTEAFGVLCKRLAPFGLSASEILLDAPTNRLGDAVMTIILLNGRIGVKFWIASFEIVLDELFENDEQNVVDISDVIFEALGKIDEDVRKGTPHIRLRYHLKLDPSENTKILHEYINVSDDSSNLVPDTAVFKLNLESNPELQNARVAIARSVVYEDALFVDMQIDYTEIPDMPSFKEKVESDVFKIFESFGLSLRINQ